MFNLPFCDIRVNLRYNHALYVQQTKFFVKCITFFSRATCPSSLFHTWETLLQEVEADVLGYSNAAAALERNVATPLIDRTFHLKVQARKVFAHREGCELILAKADDQLLKVRRASFTLSSVQYVSIHICPLLEMKKPFILTYDLSFLYRLSTSDRFSIPLRHTYLPTQ